MFIGKEKNFSRLALFAAAKLYIVMKDNLSNIEAKLQKLGAKLIVENE